MYVCVCSLRCMNEGMFIYVSTGVCTILCLCVCVVHACLGTYVHSCAWVKTGSCVCEHGYVCHIMCVLRWEYRTGCWFSYCETGLSSIVRHYRHQAPWPLSSHILSLSGCCACTCKWPHSAVHEFRRFKPVSTSLQSKDFTEPSSQLPFCILMVADNSEPGWQFPPVNRFSSVCQLSERWQEWSQRRNLYKQFTAESSFLSVGPSDQQPWRLSVWAHKCPSSPTAMPMKHCLAWDNLFAEKQMVFPFLCHRLWQPWKLYFQTGQLFFSSVG